MALRRPRASRPPLRKALDLGSQQRGPRGLSSQHLCERRGSDNSGGQGVPGAAPKLPLRSRQEKSRCPACCCRRWTKGIRISGGGAEPPACGGDRSDNPIKTGNHDDVFFLFYVKSKKRASLYELTTLILNEGSLLVLRTIMEAPLGRGLGLNPEWTLGGAACDWPPGGARSRAWALAHLSLVPLVEQGPQPITPAPEKRGTPSG